MYFRVWLTESFLIIEILTHSIRLKEHNIDPQAQYSQTDKLIIINSNANVAGPYEIPETPK